MKEVVWYLPSGAGGMAALHKTNGIKSALREWANRHNVDLNINQNATVYSENGLRYLTLTISEELATVFVLTWDNNVPKLRYEFIDDYFPPV